ncbi:hypothetical protein FOZ60_005411 [Perkinsus olseni]|uniref:Uncharacterized protein n=1 Tax=Perkinsus olseni TaxID=32597 RepID=A0A7J6NRD9_PEROL|nr:hypothetical protein FOZ60_005411 [Perkinsus olseni]
MDSIGGVGRVEVAKCLPVGPGISIKALGGSRQDDCKDEKEGEVRGEEHNGPIERKVNNPPQMRSRWASRGVIFIYSDHRGITID